jgi:hypothetical protein
MQAKANEKQPAYGRKYSGYLFIFKANINLILIRNLAIQRSDL